jgi:hypothetical protein
MKSLASVSRWMPKIMPVSPSDFFLTVWSGTFRSWALAWSTFDSARRRLGLSPASQVDRRHLCFLLAVDHQCDASTELVRHLEQILGPFVRRHAGRIKDQKKRRNAWWLPRIPAPTLPSGSGRLGRAGSWCLPVSSRTSTIQSFSNFVIDHLSSRAYQSLPPLPMTLQETYQSHSPATSWLRCAGMSLRIGIPEGGFGAQATKTRRSSANEDSSKEASR